MNTGELNYVTSALTIGNKEKVSQPSAMVEFAPKFTISNISDKGLINGTVRLITGLSPEVKFGKKRPWRGVMAYSGFDAAVVGFGFFQGEADLVDGTFSSTLLQPYGIYRQPSFE